MSVVIATYNRQDYVAEAIHSMLSQTRPVDEIFVVDDGSTDGSAAIIRTFGESIRYLRKDNGGKSSALNLALQHVKGDWVWFFDDDDVALPDALARMLDALAADTGANFAYSAQVIGKNGPDGRIAADRAVTLPDVDPDRLFHHALCQFPFLMQGMLLDRKCIDRIGPFDERYLRGQDYEFCLRLLRHFRGTPVVGPTFIWRVHDGPRGPARGRHRGVDRGAVWINFSAMMGKELRDQIPLGDYLYPRRGSNPLEAEARCQALVHRMGTMASKGLILEMLEDLSLASITASSAQRGWFGREEAKSCWRVATYECFLPAFLKEAGSITASLISRADAGTIGVLRSLARGLLWAARHAELSPADRWRLAWQALRLFVGSFHRT